MCICKACIGNERIRHKIGLVMKNMPGASAKICKDDLKTAEVVLPESPMFYD